MNHKLWVVLGTAFILNCALAHAKDVIDMAGRKLVLPEKITKVYAAQPYTTVLAYMLAPELMIGQLSATNGPEKRFLRPEYASKPILGAEAGHGQEANFETILAAKPDFVLLKGNAQTEATRSTERYAKFGIPVVFADLENIDDYAAGIEFFGKLVGKEEKARKMAAHARAALAEVDRAVATIAPDKRVKVYYAESADGLATECDQSFHADAIKRAGGEIVHKCILKTHVGMDKISLEQIIAYDPEYIVSNDPKFEESVYSDPRWKDVKAVANRHVLTVPRTPFNWIDRPPAVTRIIGIQWLAYHFYPQAFRKDMRRELIDFHQLFLGITPEPSDLEKWLKHGGS